MTITEPQLRALAELVHQVRPDWDRTGIMAALHTAAATRDLIPLTNAALGAAIDRTATTPGVISHRDGDAPAAGPRPLPAPLPFDHLNLGSPQPADVAHHGATAARAALAEAVEPRADATP